MGNFIIFVIILERIAFATIGLIAAIYGEIWWSIFMGAMLMVVIAGTSIKVRGGK